MKKIIDLTITIEEGMTTFPVYWHPFVEVTQMGRIGIEGRETKKIIIGTHTGTNLDAPRHFIENGITIDGVNYSKNKNWKQAIDKPRFHVNGDGSVRAEPDSLVADNKITITKEYDMYFGGVCVSGLNNNVFSFGDKRRGDTSWEN